MNVRRMFEVSDARIKVGRKSLRVVLISTSFVLCALLRSRDVS